MLVMIIGCIGLALNIISATFLHGQSSHEFRHTQHQEAWLTDWLTD